MKPELIKVTPVLAEGWLKKNPSNRSVDVKTVRRYVNDMLHGRWKCNGETVKFDKSGNLIDGQHRLMAIVMSKTTQSMLVVSGLDREVFDSIDIGRGRSLANVLEVNKTPHFIRVSSALAVISMYDRGISGRVRDRLQPNQAVEMLAKYPDLPDVISEIGTAKTPLLTRSLFDGLYYVFRRLDKVMVIEYMVALRDGVGIENMEAWRQLRERLIRNHTAMHRMDEVHIAALVIKGWNMARQGRDSTKLAWYPTKEEFPVAI